MGTTPNFALRYPAGSDAVTLATYFANLANDVDAKLTLYALDSGWQNLTMLTGFTSAGAQVRKIGKTVYFRGTITRVAGAYPNSFTAVATLPSSDYAPAALSRCSLAGFPSGTANGLLSLINAGDTSLQIGGAPSSTSTVYLSGIAPYLVD